MQNAFASRVWWIRDKSACSQTRYIKHAHFIFRQKLLSYAKEGARSRAPVWRSPEIIRDIPFVTPTDIWSFGTMVSRSLTAPFPFLRVLTDLSGYGSSVLSLETTTMLPIHRNTASPTNTLCTPLRSCSNISNSLGPYKIHTESCWMRNKSTWWHI